MADVYLNVRECNLWLYWAVCSLLSLATRDV